MVKPRPRTPNVYTQRGVPVVAKISHFNGDGLHRSIEKVVECIGGLERVVRRGDHVMVKPNFNCRYALPLSTDLAFLGAAIELLQDAGTRVTVGEMSGIGDWPTDQVIEQLGLLPMLRRYRVPFVNFEDDEWLTVKVSGEHLKSIHVPRTIYEAETRVYLANMRCHAAARFTASLKLAVGWLDLPGRKRLHADATKLEAKIAELNLGWQPNLVLMDGRRSTVTLDGRGAYVYPNVIMASGDMVAIDAEAVKTLKQYPEQNGLCVPIEEMGQLRTAQKLGLGSMDYMLFELPGMTRTEQESMLMVPASR